MSKDDMEIKKKDFRYRGKSLEELKKLDVREFAKYLRSKQRRNILRQFQKVESFVHSAKMKEERGKPIKTHQREIIVVPDLVGMRIRVYNGKSFEPVNITGDMLGHRLGEFALTRSRVKHSKAGVGATKGSKFKSKK